jgi:DNA-directed RNA polymerase sigma subunit (sigma70/sigma32)
MSDSILTDYLQELMQMDIPTLSKEEEHKLSAQIQSGDFKALDTLVTHNLRLVVYMVSRMTAWRHSKVPVEDIIGCGNEALVLAAKKWTPTKNNGFASYAGEYIRRYVTRELDNTERTIRLPINIVQGIKKMNYTARELTQILGRTPTVKEIANMMGVSDKKIHQLRGYINREPISLDDTINTQEDEHD